MATQAALDRLAYRWVDERTTDTERERLRRRIEKYEARALGRTWPKLTTILKVELDQIPMPNWAREKAIKGLTLTDSVVWLKRIAGRKLEALDRECGGNPRVTTTQYRPCPICRRPLIGEEAEARWELDKTFTGTQVPCGPTCLETAAKLKKEHTHTWKAKSKRYQSKSCTASPAR